jgi:hypothetical protein
VAQGVGPNKFRPHYCKKIKIKTNKQTNKQKTPKA